MRRRRLLALLLAAPGLARGAAGDAHDFGIAGFDDEVTHRFEIDNPGERRLEIAGIELTPPLRAVQATTAIAPGARGGLTVRLGTPREKGPFDGVVMVRFRDAPDRVFRLSGTIRPLVDVEPHAAFFVAVARGEQRRASLDIVNHDAAPMNILGVEHAGARSSTELQTLEPGRRWRLWLDVRGEGAAGRLAESIEVRTDHPRHARLSVQANTLLRERVYSFPERVELGTVQARRDPALAEFQGHTLMVYSRGADDFRLSASTDLPFLSLHAQRSALGDRYQIEVRLVAERLRPGDSAGSIVLDTNDAQFPRLVVPVSATVE